MNKPTIERKPLPRKSQRFPFAQMSAGDSFHFEHRRPADVANLFGIFLRKGRYRILREGNGYRFYLVK